MLDRGWSCASRARTVHSVLNLKTRRDLLCQSMDFRNQGVDLYERLLAVLSHETLIHATIALD